MNTIQIFHVGIFFMYVSTEAYYRNRVEINIRKCKLTHSGIEYQGTVFTSKFKSLCRPWNSIGVRANIDSKKYY